MRFQIHSYKFGTIILTVALLIVIVSFLFINHLVRQLSNEEQKRIELWAEATHQLILADEGTDIQFISQIIEGNNTIPVYVVDTEGNVLKTRNVTDPVRDVTQLHGPIEVKISEDLIQYIYYDDSTLLSQLRFFPYIEFSIIFLFLLIVVVSLYTAQRSQENLVWVGLSKETAHQLGTPISSLNAWKELLLSRYPNDELLPQMDADIQRLQTIAERFSKIGSEPELVREDVCVVIQNTVDYMRTRTSSKVQYYIEMSTPCFVELNIPLFAWVLENIIKNAVDAMEGVGCISLSLSRDDDKMYLDISDTGKGIERGMFNRIFEPGYTSKKRGWGLGLSLSKRIIEDYHGGKLFVKSSQVGVGSTFRISMEESKNS